jgi:hypothetical protein
MAVFALGAQVQTSRKSQALSGESNSRLMSSILTTGIIQNTLGGSTP